MKNLLVLLALTFSINFMAQARGPAIVSCEVDYDKQIGDVKHTFMVHWEGPDCDMQSRSEFVTCIRNQVQIKASKCKSEIKTSVSNIELLENLIVVQISDFTELENMMCDENKERVYNCHGASENEEANYLVAKIHNFKDPANDGPKLSRAPAITEEERIIPTKDEKLQVTQRLNPQKARLY